MSTETWPDLLAGDGEHPAGAAGLAAPPFQDRRKLPGDRQFERGTGLGVRDVHYPARQVHALPAQRQYLAPPLPEYIATQKMERVAGSFTTASMPRCQ